VQISLYFVRVIFAVHQEAMILLGWSYICCFRSCFYFEIWNG